MGQIRSPHPDRVSRIRSLLSDQELDAVLIQNLANIFYLVGFSGSDGALLISGAKTVLLVDGRYITQAGAETPSSEIVEYRDKTKGITRFIAENGFRRIGFESSVMSFQQHHDLASQTSGTDWIPIARGIEELRSIKDAEELSCIRKAIALSTRAFQIVMAEARPGICEREIAIELDYRMRREGAENVSFSTIVASGENSALPHAKPGSRRLAPGDLVVIDFGSVYRGYCSDETCTVAVGPLSPVNKEIYRIVKNAHDIALEAIKDGAFCRDIDKLVRDFIDNKGYGPYFSHATGHGVGLEVHEFPRLNRLSEAVLKSGMVITVEPGIYIPGQGGVRIEDMVLVREHGCEKLTELPKELKFI
ncbi:MAG TPA: Xaa-Pro peptidase family protein [Syntrophales bacterium]|nr:Xaa-Pro peptidase family protein [Syntrophales bacterium]